MAKIKKCYQIPNSKIASSITNLIDEFYLACGSSRLGLIKFIRGTHKNFFYDYLKNETGKWPSVNDKVWKTFDIYDFMYKAYMGSQTAAYNLIKRYRNG